MINWPYHLLLVTVNPNTPILAAAKLTSTFTINIWASSEIKWPTWKLSTVSLYPIWSDMRSKFTSYVTSWAPYRPSYKKKIGSSTNCRIRWLRHKISYYCKTKSLKKLGLSKQSPRPSCRLVKLKMLIWLRAMTKNRLQRCYMTSDRNFKSYQLLKSVSMRSLKWRILK